MDLDREKVNNFLKDIQTVFPSKYEIIIEIRKMFQDRMKGALESIKYGGLVFHVSDELVAGIFSYKNHISIEFGEGARFSDPSGLLEGKGKMRRHLKIMEKSDIKDKNVDFFVTETARIITQ